jgi:hypothetical protein
LDRLPSGNVAEPVSSVSTVAPFSVIGWSARAMTSPPNSMPSDSVAE